MEVDAPIELALPALGVTLPGYWPDIAPSPGAADERVARSTLARQTAASPPAAPSRPPPPPRPTPPAVATPEPVPPTPRSEPAPVEPAPAPKPGPPPEAQPPVTGAKRPQWWLPVAGGLLALLLIAAGAYQAGWLEWPGGDADRAPAPQPEPVAPPEPDARAAAPDRADPRLARGAARVPARHPRSGRGAPPRARPGRSRGRRPRDRAARVRGGDEAGPRSGDPADRALVRPGPPHCGGLAVYPSRTRSRRRSTTNARARRARARPTTI